jgi:hypothetical protein
VSIGRTIEGNFAGLQPGADLVPEYPLALAEIGYMDGFDYFSVTFSRLQPHMNLLWE